MLDVALLGTGGMMPLPNRYLTSLLCRLNGRMLLIDCGECTQVTMKILGWGFKNIDVICFTHFHADHISGLPGLLLTLGNSDRTEPLTLVGPAGLKYVVERLCVIAPELPFELKLIELPNKIPPDFQISIEDYNISVFAVDHGITCYAYCIQLHRKGKFDLHRALALNIDKRYWSRLQNGETVQIGDQTYYPHMVMGDNRRGIKLTYCTDTRPISALSDFARYSDLFICEGLYGDEEKRQKAYDHRHMLFGDAARIARDGQVRELWLTHFSPALTNPEQFLTNATDIFPNTILGRDRMNKTINFEE